MRAVRQNEAARGRHVGPIPVGFMRSEGVLIPVEQQELPEGYRSGLVLVREAFRLYATTELSFEGVCDALNQGGFRMPNGKLVSKYQVTEMLRNPVYIGQVVCRDQVYNGAHAAVVDVGTWQQVQTKLAQRAAHPNHAGRGGRRPGLLSGIARCSNCGAPMWFRGDAANYYQCSGKLTRARDPVCNLHGVQADVVHRHTIAMLTHLTSSPAMLEQAAAELRGQRAETAPQRPGMDRAAIEAKIKRLARLYEDGLKTDAEYTQELRVLRSQLATAEVQATVSHEEMLHQALALLRDMPSLLEAATPEELRTLVQEVFDVVYVRPHIVLAVKPADVYREMLKRAAKSYIWWAGWGSNPRPSV